MQFLIKFDLSGPIIVEIKKWLLRNFISKLLRYPNQCGMVRTPPEIWWRYFFGHFRCRKFLEMGLFIYSFAEKQRAWFIHCISPMRICYIANFIDIRVLDLKI